MTASKDDLPEMPPVFSATPFPHSISHHASSYPVDPTSAQTGQKNVTRWRKSVRQEIIRQRLALPAKDRLFMGKRIILGLDTIIGNLQDKIVSLYWPFQGEPSLLEWMESIILRGAQVALPIVLEKHKPLIFKTWAPGEKLEKGIWNIPIPVNGKPVTPEIVIAPLVAFDTHQYRLGYGGGFFDRTLANLSVKPLVIGVGYEMTRIATIFPQSYDIPMDIIVTEHQIHQS
ncbi:MAG: 5-formyltetrahydrofolate cyclo-ligase [Nitrospirales bacterium]